MAGGAFVIINGSNDKRPSIVWMNEHRNLKIAKSIFTHDDSDRETGPLLIPVKSSRCKMLHFHVRLERWKY